MDEVAIILPNDLSAFLTSNPQSENPFQNHSSFISWLLEKDDTYKAAIRWFNELAKKRFEEAMVPFNSEYYELAEQLFSQAKITYELTGNSAEVKKCENYIKKCQK